MTASGFLISALLPPLCPVCRKSCPARELGNGGPCLACRRSLAAEPRGTGPLPPDLDWVVSAFRHDGLARRALAAFKFEHRTALAGSLGSLIAARVPAGRTPGRLLPVPSSRSGHRLRGFDPATLLARELERRLSSARISEGVLVRVGPGGQRGRGREARLEGADRFEAVGRLDGPHVLVDDVITTGGTVSACARAIRAAGAGPIGAITLTRRA